MAADSKSMFVSDERRAWMRTRSHTVVWDRDPQFTQYEADRSGSVMTVFRIWVADGRDPWVRRYFLGSVRHCECGGWMSGLELRRLFRQATITAGLSGENAQAFRARLSRYLRECVV